MGKIVQHPQHHTRKDRAFALDTKQKCVLKKNEVDKWKVTLFHDVHNHELIQSPSKTCFLQSHGKITAEDKEFVEILHEQNISTQQIRGAIS